MNRRYITPTDWHDRLPKQWQERLHRYLSEKHGAEHYQLSAIDFPDEKLMIQFPDGSHVTFLFAFSLVNKETREIAIFSEHCGYHIFPMEDTEVSTTPIQ